MSYDVSFIVKLEGVDDYVRIYDSDANITWNVHKLIQASSGWYIKNNCKNRLMVDLATNIRNGLKNLTDNPEEYRQYESPNGWGTIEGVKNFYSIILSDWDYLRKVKPKLVNVVWLYIS